MEPPFLRPCRSALRGPLGSAMCEVERELIFRTLAFAGGNKARASNLLGMSRRNLYNRLQRYDEREINGDANRYHIPIAGMAPLNSRESVNCQSRHTCTTELHDRHADEVTLDEIERVGI